MSETQTWYKVKCSRCNNRVRKKNYDGVVVCKPCREAPAKILAIYRRQSETLDGYRALLDRDYSATDRLGPPAWSESIESIADAAYWHWTGPLPDLVLPIKKRRKTKETAR